MTTHADRRGRTATKRKVILRRKILPLLVAGCFGCGTASANPTGAQVVNGQVGFTTQGNTLSITNSPGSIINWQSFFINSGETTRFIQQNSASSVLNRIVGQDPSQILGALQSNGRVFLINPNGILFGQGSRIDVNGLVASSLNLSNEDFLAGRMNFKAGDKAGSVQNQGVITTPSGGQVYLIAPDVENNGIIISPQGDVMLAAGHSVQLVDSANPDVQVVLSASQDEARNLGQIVAQGGRIGIYGALISQRGLVSADSAVVGENGKIVFKASGQTLLEAGSRTSATGAGQGGEIHILGDHVGLLDNAVVDASGNSGGGTVLVGGDYQGANPAIRNASRTYVGPDAQIKADALDNGDGGKVVVWSNEATRAYGSISVRGGAQGGDGGSVETSGHYLDTAGARVDAGAPKGRIGTWLLDPYDIEVADAGGSTTLTDFDQFADLPATGTSTVSAATISAASANVMLQATHDINFTDAVDIVAANVGLTAKAGNDINVNNTIGTNGGAITLSANDAGGPASGTGKLTINSAISSKGGAINLSGASVDIWNPVASSGGNITVAATGGGIENDGGDLDGRNAGSLAGTVTLASAGPIDIYSGTAIHADKLKMTAVGGITDGSYDYISTDVNSLNAKNSGGGDIRVNNLGPLAITDIGSTGYGLKQVNAGDVVISADGITVGSGITTNGGEVALTALNGVNINNAIGTSNGYVSISGDTVAFSSSGSVSAGANQVDITAPTSISVASGALIKVVGGFIGPSSKIKPAGTIVVDGSYSRIALSSDSITLGGSLDAGGPTGGGYVTIASYDGTRAIDLGTKTAGTLGLTASELQNISATTLDISSSSGNVNVSSAVTFASSGIKMLHLSSTGDIGIDKQLTLNATDSSIALSSSAGQIAISSTGGLKTTGSGSISLYANNMDIQGLINAGSGTVGLMPADTAVNIEVGAGAADVPGATLGLTDAELKKITTSGTLTIGDSGSSGSLTVVGALDLTSGAGLTGSLTLAGGSGNLLINGAITTPGDLQLSTSGALSINATVTGGASGTRNVDLEADSIALNTGSGLESVIGGIVSFHPYSNAYPITVGSTTCNVSPCLTVTDLYKVKANTIGIGSDGDVSAKFGDSSGNVSGDIYVAGITANTGSNLATDLNAATTRIGLLTSGGITQGGAIEVQDLGIVAGAAVDLQGYPNKVANLAANTNGYDFDFRNAQALTVTTLSGGAAPHTYSLAGISADREVCLMTDAGAINVSSPIDGGTGSIMLSSGTGAVSGSAVISGGSLNVSANGGISLKTKVSSLTAYNYDSGNIIVTNSIPLTLYGIQQIMSDDSPSPGSIKIDNTGALTVAGGYTVSTGSGNISLVAHSPLTVDGAVSTDTGSITLEAGATGIVGAGDTLTIGSTGSVTSTSGNITLKAGDAIVIDPLATVTTSGSVNQSADLNTPTAVTPPTIDQCIADPTLTGCSTVLPTLTQCVATPTLSGCSVVLPTLTQCSADPTLTGCSVVLPTLSQCVATPTLSGCSVVLPTLTQCVATPTLSGCSVVLPTLTQCVATPALTGCSVVLPTLSQCVSTPTLSGCSVVLPTVSQCAATPTLEGCGVVLPTLSQCIATPTLANCSLVLPTLTQCTATPALAGCSVILPTLTQCTVTPSLAGCSAVLPTLAQCTSTPTLAGCSAVLPPLSDCTTTPTLPGCTIVLPTTQAPDNEPLNQAINTTVNLINTTYVTTLVKVIVPNGTDTGGGSNLGSNSSDSSEKKQDNKSDTVATLTDSGVKKNDTAPKMYCN